MKIILYSIRFLFILSYISVPLKAQEWTFCHPYSPSQARQVAVMGDSLVLFTLSEDSYECTSREIFAFDMNQKIKWDAPGGDFIVFNDSSILTGGFTFPLSDVGSINYFYLRKTDLDGKITGQFYYPENQFSASENLITKEALNISMSSDGNMLICSSEDLVIFYSDGTRGITKKYQEDTVILGAYFSPQYNYAVLLVTTERIFAMDAFTGDEIVSFSPGFTIEDHWFRNDTVYLLSNDTIYFMDDHFSGFLDTIPLPGDVPVEDFKVYERNIWIYGKISDQEKLQSVSLDDNHESTNYDLRRDYLVGEIDFIIHNDGVIVTGRTQSNQAALISYDLNEIPSFDLPDAAISDLNIVVTDWDYYTYEDESYAIGYNFDVTFTITNNGSDILHTATFYSRLNGNFNCTFNEPMWTESDMDLAPGETTSITMNHLYQQSPFSNDICFSVRSPNNQIDANPADNSICKYFPVSVQEEISDTDMQIFPVPASDYINLKFSSAQNRYIRIYDLAGNVLVSLTTGESEFSIPVHKLKKGMYILKVQGVSGTETSKIEVL